MPRPIKLKIVIRVLQEKGFFFVSQNGSHAKFKNDNNPSLTVIVKMGKKDIPHGTFQSILLHSKLKEEDFRKNN